MNLKRSRVWVLGAVLGLFCSQLPAAAKSLAELQESFKSRYAKIAELKAAGTIGETSDGFVEAVKAASGDVKSIMDAENVDRTELYAAMAKQEGATPELVARRNAVRNFGKAKPGEFLKKDGQWRQK